uniref:Protein argonaute n=1 Tax=candidate division WOR-3 bacterium TaxID=2052148 RepID=A0A7C2P1T7_UNCW3
MYVRKIPTNLLLLRVGMGATTFFPSKGIESAGPLEVLNTNISLKVICDVKNKDKVASLLGKIRKELCDVFKIKIEEETEEIVEGSMIEKIKDLAHKDTRQPEAKRPIYLVITEKEPKDDPGATYYKIKEELLSNNILSQVVTTDTLDDPRKMSEMTTFRNIALGIFVKADNTPWYLQMPVTLSGRSEETLIVGVGITSLRKSIFSKETHRYVGYFSFYNSRGVWKRLTPLFSSIEEIQKKIQRSLSEGIERTVSKEVSELDVIIHYAGKEVKKDEEEIIHDTLVQHAEGKGIKVNYAIVRLIKSPVYRLFSNHEYGYAPMGAYVDFENNLVLINTTGLLGRNTTPMGVNTPILASIRKTNLEVNPNLVHNVVYSIIGLARMNWRGVSAFNFEPATTKYAREIAYTMAHLGEKIYQNESTLRFLQDKMWFI